MFLIKQEAEADLTSPSEAWSPTDTTPIIPESKRPPPVSWSQPQLNARKVQNSWEDTEFEPLEEKPGSASKLEEARKKREERKLMKQKEMEARRAARNAGPMKLGVKKL